jgi:hypothetical protein
MDLSGQPLFLTHAFDQAESAEDVLSASRKQLGAAIEQLSDAMVRHATQLRAHRDAVDDVLLHDLYWLIPGMPAQRIVDAYQLGSPSNLAAAAGSRRMSFECSTCGIEFTVTVRSRTALTEYATPYCPLCRAEITAGKDRQAAVKAEADRRWREERRDARATHPPLRRER